MAKKTKRKSGTRAKNKSKQNEWTFTTSNIGFLLAAKPEDWDAYIKSFTRELKNKYKNQPVDPPNITFLPPRGADGNQKAVDDAADYFAQYADIIVTAGTYAARTCLRATQLYSNATTGRPTPFIFASIGDPSPNGSNLTPNPNDNFCGGDNKQTDLMIIQKRVDHMLKAKKFKGDFAVVGVYAGTSKTAMDAVLVKIQAAGETAYLEPIARGTTAQAFITSLQNKKRYKSLFVCSDLYVTSIAQDLADAAANANPPMQTMWEFAEHKYVHHGDAAYGVSFTDMFTMAADAAADILMHNATPGQLGIWTAPDGPA